MFSLAFLLVGWLVCSGEASLRPHNHEYTRLAHTAHVYLATSPCLELSYNVLTGLRLPIPANFFEPIHLGAPLTLQFGHVAGFHKGPHIMHQTYCVVLLQDSSPPPYVNYWDGDSNGVSVPLIGVPPSILSAIDSYLHREVMVLWKHSEDISALITKPGNDAMESLQQRMSRLTILDDPRQPQSVHEQEFINRIFRKPTLPIAPQAVLMLNTIKKCIDDLWRQKDHTSFNRLLGQSSLLKAQISSTVASLYQSIFGPKGEFQWLPSTIREHTDAYLFEILPLLDRVVGVKPPSARTFTQLWTNTHGKGLIICRLLHDKRFLRELGQKDILRGWSLLPMPLLLTFLRASPTVSFTKSIHLNLALSCITHYQRERALSLFRTTLSQRVGWHKNASFWVPAVWTRLVSIYETGDLWHFRAFLQILAGTHPEVMQPQYLIRRADGAGSRRGNSGTVGHSVRFAKPEGKFLKSIAKHSYILQALITNKRPDSIRDRIARDGGKDPHGLLLAVETFLDLIAYHDQRPENVNFNKLIRWIVATLDDAPVVTAQRRFGLLAKLSFPTVMTAWLRAIDPSMLNVGDALYDLIEDYRVLTAVLRQVPRLSLKAHNRSLDREPDHPLLGAIHALAPVVKNLFIEPSIPREHLTMGGPPPNTVGTVSQGDLQIIIPNGLLRLSKLSHRMNLIRALLHLKYGIPFGHMSIVPTHPPALTVGKLSNRHATYWCNAWRSHLGLHTYREVEVMWSPPPGPSRAHPKGGQ